MRCKLKTILWSGVILLNLVIFTRLISIQTINTSFHGAKIGVQGGLPLLIPRDLSLNVTSQLQRQTEATTFSNKNGAENHSAAKTKRVTKIPNTLPESDCPQAKYPSTLSLDEGWYPVDDMKKVYVFSAYHDENAKDTLTVIGAAVNKAKPYICQFWNLSSDGESATVFESDAKAQMLPEGHARRYTATLFTCPVKEGLIPELVAIVPTKCAQPINLLSVQRILKKPYNRKFTVCLTPFNYRYGKAYELVEWIELNRILGADHFTVYDYSTARNVKRVLEYYQDQGIVDVVNWDLPMGVDTWPRTGQPVEIHYFGQIGAINDCWRRNKQYSEYLVYVDLDEFIIPRDNDTVTWSAILSKLPKAGVYIFRNVFVRKEWNDTNLSFDDIDVARDLKLVTLLKTVRENQIFNYGQRSKYIIRSDSAHTLGIHTVPKLQPGSLYTHRVPESAALLYHYRNWEVPDDKKARTNDYTVVNKYRKKLINEVKNTWSNLPGVEKDIPIV